MEVEYRVTAGSLSEIKHIVELIEGDTAKREPMQPVVLSQDATLDPDKPGVLPAWNPLGVIEEYGDWIDKVIAHWETVNEEDRPEKNETLNMMRWVRHKFRQLRSQGGC